MNIRNNRWLLLVVVMLLLLGAFSPQLLLAQGNTPPNQSNQQSQAEANVVLYPPVLYADDDGNALIEFDLLVEGLRGHELLITLLPIYADSGFTMPNMNGDENYTDEFGNLASFITAPVDFDSTIWDGDSVVVMFLPSDGFPLGNYDWWPSFEVYDLTAKQVVAGWDYSDPEFHMSYRTDFVDYVGHTLGDGVEVNKVHYQYDAEYIYIVFDLSLYGFTVGQEILVNIFPIYLEDDTYIPSTGAVPANTDSDGDIFGWITLTYEYAEGTVWLESNDNQVVISIPLANFPRGEYIVYPNWMFFMKNRAGEWEAIKSFDTDARTTWISK